MTEKFKVLLTGIPDGSNHDEVAQNLSRLFKTDPAKVEALFKKPQAVIKTDLTKEAAEKYKTALEKAGASVKVVPLAPSTPPRPEPAPIKIERKEKKQEEEEKRPEPKATCPGCGYEAMSPDDPLITAHDGDGECPRCGVVPKKLIKAQEAQAVDNDPDGIVSIIEPKSGLGLLTHPVTRVIMVTALILFFVGGWYLLSRNTESTTAHRQSDVERVRAIHNLPIHPPADAQTSNSKKEYAPSTDNVCFIPPEENRTFTLSGPVPYIHPFDGYTLLDGAYGLAFNEWKYNGIEVELIDSHIFSDPHLIWTGGIETKIIKTGEVFNSFIPILPDGKLARVSVDRTTGTEIYKAPIHVSKVEKLILQGEMTLDDSLPEWKRAWAKGPTPRIVAFEQRNFAFYYFTATFVVNVPSLDALEKAHKQRSILNSSLGFGPKNLNFTSGVNVKPVVKGQGTSQIAVRLDAYRNVGKIQGVRAELYNKDYTLTCE